MSRRAEPVGGSLPTPAGATEPAGLVHLPALDGIRGMAILLVLFDHLFWANSNTGSRIFDLLSAVRESSYVGVNLFFALSGFLITGILLDTRDAPGFFRNFYARRTLRIFPLYYGVLAVILLATRPLHIVWNGWQYFFLTYTANLALWPRPALGMPYLNINHFWSLQVEEQFYLFWPLVVYRVRNLRNLLGLATTLCVVILFIRVGIVAARPWLHNPFLPYSPTFSCADNLLYGCCLAALLRTSHREKVLRLAPRVFALASAILLVAGVYHGSLNFQESTFIPTVGFSLLGIASAALIAMALRAGSRTQGIFADSTLRFFGKYSYGIYVFHYSVAGALNPPFRAFFDARFHNKGIGVLAGATVSLIVSVLLAFASYHLYEVHFLALKRYFRSRKATPLLSGQAVAQTG